MHSRKKHKKKKVSYITASSILGTSQNVILIVEEKAALGCQYTATRLHDVKSKMY